MSPQLIDLPLKKGWYVSLQITRQDDLKLAVERFKVWHCVAMHCIGRSMPVSCHCYFQRRALNLVACALKEKSMNLIWEQDTWRQFHSWENQKAEKVGDMAYPPAYTWVLPKKSREAKVLNAENWVFSSSAIVSIPFCAYACFSQYTSTV